jgi:hypothetical protein
MIDVLARRFGEIPEPGVNWGSLLEFADLADRIEAGEMPISIIKEAVREQLAGLAERQAARAEKRRTRNRQALARKRLPPEQRVDRRKGAW